MCVGLSACAGEHYVFYYNNICMHKRAVYGVCMYFVCVCVCVCLSVLFYDHHTFVCVYELICERLCVHMNDIVYLPFMKQ